MSRGVPEPGATTLRGMSLALELADALQRGERPRVLSISEEADLRAARTWTREARACYPSLSRSR